MSQSDIEDRLVRIETKLGFAEDLLDELNQLVYKQQAQIDRLEAALQQLAKRAELNQLPAQHAQDPRDNIPPHY